MPDETLAAQIAARTGYCVDDVTRWVQARGYGSMRDVPQFFNADLRNFIKLPVQSRTCD